MDLNHFCNHQFNMLDHSFPYEVYQQKLNVVLATSPSTAEINLWAVTHCLTTSEERANRGIGGLVDMESNLISLDASVYHKDPLKKGVI